MESKGDKIIERLRSINYGIARMMYRLIKPLGLSPSQGRMLMELKKRGGAATLSELADGMDTPYSNASNVCNRLEGRGLIVKSRDEIDKRIVRIAFTPKGKEELSRLKSSYLSMMDSISEVLRDAEIAEIESALTKLDEGMRRAMEKYDPSPQSQSFKPSDC